MLPLAMQVFQCSMMSVDDFRSNLQDVLNLAFSPAEFSAILGMLDPKRTGTIDCQKFLNQFYRLGNDHRDRIKRELRRQQQEINERRRYAFSLSKLKLSTPIVLNVMETTQ